MKSGAIFRGTAAILSALCYPAYCPACHYPLNDGTGFLCPECWRNLEGIEKKIQFDAGGKRRRIHAVFAYNGSMRNLVHQMKFHGRTDIITVLGGVMAERLADMGLVNEGAIVVPVPLHPVRVRERGYDQTALLGAVIAESLGLDMRQDIIRRVRNTKPQSRLSDPERRVNLHDAFVPNRPAPVKPDVEIILVDDVVHTGSTMRGCFEALSAIGVNRLGAVAAFG